MLILFMYANTILVGVFMFTNGRKQYYVVIFCFVFFMVHAEVAAGLEIEQELAGNKRIMRH